MLQILSGNSLKKEVASEMQAIQLQRMEIKKS